MFVQPTFATVIDTIIWSSFAEIAFYRIHTLFHKSGYFILIPFYSRRIGQVEHSIFIRRPSCCILHLHIVINQLLEKFILRCEIWQLPQVYMEPHFLHLLEHRYGIRETVFGKLIITLPVGTEPSRIEMDYICRNLM